MDFVLSLKLQRSIGEPPVHNSITRFWCEIVNVLLASTANKGVSHAYLGSAKPMLVYAYTASVAL